ncbi:enoyl-CoA hydratase-related protein [Rhodospirillum centenum]|uniref:Enoyl-CoA hydratase n=1 Tax=Rhodospirillum centenum (strain ATCC 51521 / SW) TaxID=414684 RepID=B6IX65_RHOCS|nr:enoyl-CoA hydratase-related protein [Rhodospirillum centenum]ACJ00889.1 enoyl-CoA hydratase [Rhodospirillum centenum SW]
MSMPDEFQTLLVRRHGWRLDVTLNRPESRNAMSGAMVAELLTVFEAAAADTGLRAIVLRGAGGTFCAGGDLRDMGSGPGGSGPGGSGPGGGQDGSDPAAALAAMNRAFGTMLQAAETVPQVLVAVIEGAAMGGGFGLACVSDVAIARDDASFGMPEVRLGVVPAQIAPFVVRRIGLPQARRLALTGGRLKAVEAQALGLLHHVEGADALEARLAEVLDGVRLSAPGAVAATKRLLLEVERGDLPALLDRAAHSFADAVLGEGQKGLPAFLMKKPAPWAVAGGDLG